MDRRCFMRPGLWTGMFFRHGLPLRDTLQFLKRAGFDCAELCECYAVRLLENEAFRREEPLLPLSQCHAPRLSETMGTAEIAEFFERFAAMLEYFHIGCCVFHPLADSGRNREVFRVLAGIASEHGFRVAVENLIGTEAKRLEDLLADVPGLGVNLDSAHACANRENPAELIRFFGRHVYGVHLSDSDGEPRDLHLTPGRGILNWEEIVKALDEVRYAGDFHLELPHERGETVEETFRAARHAAETVRPLLARRRDA